tara:strand:- start:1502 stop:1927 length:426 start_codon:yes stop_codon:yes gene_type:complete
MPVRKIISAAAKAAKKAGKKSKVISSKQMSKRLDDKVKAKAMGKSLTQFRKDEKLINKMSGLSESSSAYKKLQDKLMDIKVPSKDPFPLAEQAIKRPRRLKPIPGTRRVVDKSGKPIKKKQFGGKVYNNRGMSVPGMRYGN